MNLAELSCLILIVVVCANVILLLSRKTGSPKTRLVQGTIAIVLLIGLVYAYGRMIPRTRFLSAAASGDLEAVRNRLEQDPTLITARGFGNWTALHHAARSGHLKVVQYLVEHGASMDTKAMGETPFGLAVAWGYYDCVELMLREGVDVNQRSFRQRSTAVHIAASRGHTAIVRLLLDHGADASLPNRREHGTPLTDAKNDAIRKLLLEYEANE